MELSLLTPAIICIERSPHAPGTVAQADTDPFETRADVR